MKSRLFLLLTLLLPFGLAGCGGLPAPFWGNPGENARRLVQPLSPMLAIPAPTNAMLPEAASAALASTSKRPVDGDAATRAAITSERRERA